MNEKQLVFVNILVVFGLVAFMGFWMERGNFIPPLIGFVGFFLLLSYLNRKVKTIDDEMLQRMREKATLRAWQAIAIIAVPLGIFLAIGTESFSQAGYTILYSLCAMAFIEVIFFYYYRIKGLK
ncbi:MAG: hypothetical protein PWR30_69 [Candidatus Woesearchaeota archaeon]|nr:hypothetical protein [Candidatus Woesearchaeota archaeon]